jgi:hypothetical protein
MGRLKSSKVGTTAVIQNRTAPGNAISHSVQERKKPGMKNEIKTK